MGQKRIASIPKFFGKIVSKALALPAVCLLCRHYHSQPVAVCQACILLFKRIGLFCRYCAFPLPEQTGNQFLVCGNCSKEKPWFDSTLTAYLFEEPLRAVLHEFKYKEALYLRSFLVELMLEAWPRQDQIPQCLIPVPLHPKRLSQRGYNQAAELSKLLAKKLGLRHELRLCQKSRHTDPQVSLNRKNRQANLQNAFQSQPTSYQHVMLVDDLLTTGSTANELARVLKQQGVRRVDLWCCARAV